MTAPARITQSDMERATKAVKTAAELAERQKLRDVVATALAKDKIAEIRDAERTHP